MGILVPKATPAPVVSVEKQDPVIPVDYDYKTVIEDGRYTSHNHLLTYIAGSSWVVTYFQQQLGKDDEPTAQDLNKDPVYQQYIRISDFELKVSSSLSESQDATTKEFEVTGEATIYPPVLPNKGDMFIADIGDGRDAVFAIVSTERLTILKKTCYNISYILVDFAVDARIEDFNRKTVEETHFLKSLLNHGVDPVVVDEDYNRHLSLKDLRGKLMGAYFGRFFQKNVASLAVPGQDWVTFDPFLVKCIKSFMETREHPMLRNMKNYSVELPGRALPLTIWDVLMRFSIDMLPLVNEKLALVDSHYFGTVPQFEGVYYSNINSVVYPVDMGNSDINSMFIKPAGTPTRDIGHQFETTRLASLAMLPAISNIGFDNLPSIWPVTKDEFYIFSKAFYHGIAVDQSQLEALVLKALSGEPINQKALYELSTEVDTWGYLEQFYYVPVLMILIKMVLHGL